MKSSSRSEVGAGSRSVPGVTLTSLNNPVVKQMRGLRLRKERERTGLCFVEGIRFVDAALRSQAQVETLVVVPDQIESVYGQRLLMGLRRSRPPNLCVSSGVLAAIAGREDTQGIGAIVRQRWEALEQIDPDQARGWIVLDGIQYPGNLGTILRVCDAVGFGGVILIGPTADPYDPVAVRASTGAVFFLRLVRASFEELLEWKTRHRVALVGASPTAPLDYRQVSYPAPVLIYLGCESQGLSAERQALCDHLVQIPMGGQCDSLNVALAAGLVLYEVFHQARRQEQS